MRMRPLWFVIIATVWATIGYFFSLVLDDFGLSWAKSLGVEGMGYAIVAGVPWLIHSLILLGGFLWWVIYNPAWHPWRDGILAGVIASIPSGLIHAIAIAWGEIDRTTDPGVAEAIVGVLILGVGMTIAVPMSVVAANKMWKTPEPKREKYFGERDTT